MEGSAPTSFSGSLASLPRAGAIGIEVARGSGTKVSPFLSFPHALRILSVFKISVGFSVAASISAPQLSCIRSMKCNIERYQGCYIVEEMCHCAKAFCCNNPFKYPSLDSCLANNTQQLGKLQTFWFRESLAVSFRAFLLSHIKENRNKFNILSLSIDFYDNNSNSHALIGCVSLSLTGNKWTSVFHASAVLLLTVNFVMTLSK